MSGTLFNGLEMQRPKVVNVEVEKGLLHFIVAVTIICTGLGHTGGMK